MARLSDKHEPSELVAIVGMPPDSPERIKPSADALVAVVDRPSSPGNLGSIIRSSHALGADGVIVTGVGTDSSARGPFVGESKKGRQLGPEVVQQVGVGTEPLWRTTLKGSRGMF